jgi:3D (Asp-Asp-Asp) domain-containing protein
MYETHARNVAEFLGERNVTISDDDYLSNPPDTVLSPGMRIEHRSAVSFSLSVDGQRIALHSAPASVADLLNQQGVKLGPNDEVTPALGSRLSRGTVVRVVRVDEWTGQVREPIAPGVRHRFDPQLALGQTRTVDPGLPGERELTVRFIKRGDDREKRVVLATRVVQEARPRVIVHGIGEFVSLVSGVQDALKFAGTAMHMVATAYVPWCSGCSGITKLGMHAGHGVVAVDPNVIPLGSRLYVPGYGAAVAGDTGGAIHGNRIDLGFNDLGEALRFGRRPITVYVLR